MSRLRWPDSTNSVSEKPGTIQIGFLKGKSAVRIPRNLLRERRMTGLHFWSTVSAQSVWRKDGSGSTFASRSNWRQDRGTWTSNNPEPAPEGPSQRQRPPRGAFLKPRPMGVVDDLTGGRIIASNSRLDAT